MQTALERSYQPAALAALRCLRYAAFRRLKNNVSRVEEKKMVPDHSCACVKFLVYRKIKCLLGKISRSAASVALLPQAGGRKSGGQEFAAERSRIWGSHTRLCYAFWESSVAFLPTAGFKQRL